MFYSGDQVEMPELPVVNKLCQLSHMAILHEGMRPEPRLRRLLGHISTYDNAERWRTENQQQIYDFEMARHNNAQKLLKLKPAYQSSIIPSGPTLKLRTLAEFQVAIGAHLQAEQQTTVSTEEVFLESDSEEEADSSETPDDDSDDESTRSDEEDPIIELIEEGTMSLLQQDIKDDVFFYRSTSEYPLQAAKTEKR